MEQHKLRKRQYLMFAAGLTALLMGLSVLAFLVVRKVRRDMEREQLMRENVTITIPDLNIRAPVLEGTDNEILAKAAGHFPNTGSPGHGNYCVAGHSSVIYKEYFNQLKNVRIGMEVYLYDQEQKSYMYTVTESFIVEPDETWVLKDFEDHRITIITCTDDGTQRQVVVGKLHEMN